MSEEAAAIEAAPGRTGRRALRVLAGLVVVTLVLILAGLGGLAWRLSDGPISLDRLLPRAERAIDARIAPARIGIAHASLAWNGFHAGATEPLVLALRGLALRDAGGRLRDSVPAASFTLAPGPLLLGRLALRGLTLDTPSLALRRDADGALHLDGTAAGPAKPRPASAPSPPHGLPPALAGLASLDVVDGTVRLADDKLGVAWRASAISVDLRRPTQGAVSGRVSLRIGAGGQAATLEARATHEDGGTHLRASLSPLDPAALAGADTRLAVLAGTTTPVSLAADLVLGPDFVPRGGHASATLGAGRVALGADAALMLQRATLRLAISGGRASLDGSFAVLAPPASDPGAPPPQVSLGGTIAPLGARAGGGLHAALTLGFDQARFADLAAYWPDIGGGGARPWVTGNITDGTATGGHIAIGLDAADDLSHLRLTALTGGVSGSGLTLHWLRPVPPATGADATLTVLNPHTLVIVATGAHQGPIPISKMRFRVDGLDTRDQDATLDLTCAGSVPAALALLAQKRLHLLSDHKLPVSNATGSFTDTLHMTLPLVARLTMAQIGIDNRAHLTGVRLGDLVGGYALQDATIDLAATQAGMNLDGNGLLAGAQSSFKVGIDFGGGPPSQVLEHASVLATVSPADLARAGVPNTDRLSGTARLSLDYAGRRDGTATASVAADLTAAGVSLPIGWAKRAGETASASAEIALSDGRLTGIEQLAADGPGLLIRSHVEASDGRPALLSLDRVEIGGSGGRGTVAFPADDRAPIAVRFAGDTLDLAARFKPGHPAGKAATPVRPAPPAPPVASSKPSRPWTLDARFGRVLLASGQALAEFTARLRDDGRRIAEAQVASTGPTALRIAMAPSGTGRSLRLSAADAGSLFAGLGLSKAITGGRLDVTGQFDDRAAGDPLAGQLTLRDFRVPAAPHAARVLQGATIYGLAGLDRPGIGFSRLVAPFRFADDTLYLGEARASNPAMGFTATGTVALDAGRVALTGTIVPAYFFNHLLGRLPVVGRLFSPEKGGGVFAATYTLTGPLADPQLRINALSALAPGALRKLVGGGS